MTNDSENQWPSMAESEFGDDNLAIDGTTPISVATIGAWGANNKPMAFIESAGCAYCNRWAVDFYLGADRTSDGEFFNSVARRADFSLIYFCDQHQQSAMAEILEKYGSASNMLNFDLERAVEKHRGMRAREASE